MKLSSLMKLRAVCEAFMQSTMDETAGDEIADPVIAGQLEAILYEASSAFHLYVFSKGSRGDEIVKHLLNAIGLEVRKKK